MVSCSLGHPCLTSMCVRKYMRLWSLIFFMPHIKAPTVPIYSPFRCGELLPSTCAMKYMRLWSFRFCKKTLALHQHVKENKWGYGVSHLACLRLWRPFAHPSHVVNYSFGHPYLASMCPRKYMRLWSFTTCIFGPMEFNKFFSNTTHIIGCLWHPFACPSHVLIVIWKFLKLCGELLPWAILPWII